MLKIQRTNMATCNGALFGAAKLPAASRHINSTVASSSFLGGKAALRTQARPFVADQGANLALVLNTSLALPEG